MTLLELSGQIEQELTERNLWFEDAYLESFQPGIYILRVIGLRGDWKHDHLYLDCIIRDELEKKYSWMGYSAMTYSEVVTEEDGSDYYTADHSYLIFTCKEELV